jgi:hypothetical protein
MGKINLNRVILGGLLAGVVINIVEGVSNGVIFQNQWAEVMTSLGKAPAPSVKQIIALNVWGFALGILTVWLYAAIRPRFGEGPRTALCAGLVAWFLTPALGNAIPVFFHLYKVDLAVSAVAVELVEMLVAAVVGAYVYKEDSVEVPRAAAARA